MRQYICKSAVVGHKQKTVRIHIKSANGIYTCTNVTREHTHVLSAFLIGHSGNKASGFVEHYAYFFVTHGNYHVAAVFHHVNTRLNRLLGPDTGFDMIAQNSCGGDIAALLAALDESGECPKTILYSLNPADNEQLGTLIGCFQSDEVPGKIQHGSAWWFNDTKSGMEAQMKSLANLGLLGNFVGMLTDSRSFLSYARHDYFRRIFCNLVGNWVESGEYPANEAALRRIVEGVSYANAARYFNL